MKAPDTMNAKLEQLDQFRATGEGFGITTTEGVKISDNQNTLKAGARGPSLLEDFHFNDKLAHFDRERIPERVVHARGSGARGYFGTESQAKYTKAAFLRDPQVKRPYSYAFPTCRASGARPTPCATFAALPPNSTPARATSTWWATIPRYSSSRTPSNFRTSSTR